MEHQILVKSAIGYRPVGRRHGSAKKNISMNCDIGRYDVNDILYVRNIRLDCTNTYDKMDSGVVLYKILAG